MCMVRFEETPKKFNAGSTVRLIDILRRPDVNGITPKKNDMSGDAQRN